MRWSCFSVGGSGGGIDPNNVIPKERDGAWRTILMRKDNLSLNDIIVGCEEKVLDATGDMLGYSDDRCATLLALNCLGHSIIHATEHTQSAGSTSEGLGSKLVRLGHLLESGRVCREFNTCFDAKTLSLGEGKTTTSPPVPKPIIPICPA